MTNSHPGCRREGYPPGSPKASQMSGRMSHSMATTSTGRSGSQVARGCRAIARVAARPHGPNFFSDRLSLGEILGVPERVWGGVCGALASKAFLASPKKSSGTFPSVFGDCFRGFHLKSTSPKKNSGTFPNVFGECFRKFPPKSASPKKNRERSRVFLGVASEDFPKVSLPAKNSGTFPIPYHMSLTRNFETTNANAKIAQNHFTTPYGTVSHGGLYSRKCAHTYYTIPRTLLRNWTSKTPLARCIARHASSNWRNTSARKNHGFLSQENLWSTNATLPISQKEELLDTSDGVFAGILYPLWYLRLLCLYSW